MAAEPHSKTVAILEAVCAGLLGTAEGGTQLERELIAEGGAMLESVCRAIIAAGGNVITLVDPRLRRLVPLPEEGITICEPPLDALKTVPSRPEKKVCEVVSPNVAAPITSSWLTMVRGADIALVVAPETGGMLTSHVEQLEWLGAKTFNCTGAFTRFAGDKYAVAQYCHEVGLLHPPTWLLGDWLRDPEARCSSGRWCIKPRDGVGCVDLLRFENAEGLRDHIATGVYSAPDEWIVQHWVEGIPMSRGYIAAPTGHASGEWMRQRFESRAGPTEVATAFSFLAGERETDTADAPACDKKFVERLNADWGSSLRGWLGCDFVHCTTGELVLIEINPRLTTTFAAAGNEVARATFAASLLNAAL